MTGNRAPRHARLPRQHIDAVRTFRSCVRKTAIFPLAPGNAGPSIVAGESLVTGNGGVANVALLAGPLIAVAPYKAVLVPLATGLT